MDGTLYDVDVASLYHGIETAPEGGHRVSVARRQTHRLDAVVDECRPELGPPESLLEEFTALRTDLKMRGMCEEGAHNLAWENTSFEGRYRAYLDDSSEAAVALDYLGRRLQAGDVLVLVSHERAGTERTHRRTLRERLESP